MAPPSASCPSRLNTKSTGSARKSAHLQRNIASKEPLSTPWQGAFRRRQAPKDHPGEAPHKYQDGSPGQRGGGRAHQLPDHPERGRGTSARSPPAFPGSTPPRPISSGAHRGDHHEVAPRLGIMWGASTPAACARETASHIRRQLPLQHQHPRGNTSTTTTPIVAPAPGAVGVNSPPAR
jgi:hypothetical protein